MLNPSALAPLSCLFLHRLKSWDLTSLCNGALVGFVSVTAGSAVLEPWAAILCAVTGVMVFDAMCAVSGGGGDSRWGLGAYVGVHAMSRHPARCDLRDGL